MIRLWFKKNVGGGGGGPGLWGKLFISYRHAFTLSANNLSLNCVLTRKFYMFPNPYVSACFSSLFLRLTLFLSRCSFPVDY